MPELPEVETIRRGLAEAARGRRIVGIRMTPAGERLLQGVPPEAFAARLQGRRIEDVRRRGKYLLFLLDDGAAFVCHLRMTGRFEVEPGDAADGPFFRAALRLDDGHELRWRDARRFGTWAIYDDLVALDERLGPEPLGEGFTVERLADALAGRRAPIKAVLLDQRRVAGLGNIYVDEALHLARIHPQRPAGTLTRDEIARLHAAIRVALDKGIANFGTTFRSFVNAFGGEGRNREHLLVYGRQGEPCASCGTPIARIVVGGRGTHLCPMCQPFGGAGDGDAGRNS